MVGKSLTKPKNLKYPPNFIFDTGSLIERVALLYAFFGTKVVSFTFICAFDVETNITKTKKQQDNILKPFIIKLF